MIRYRFRRWRARRAAARFRAAAAEFHQAAGRLQFAALCELIVAHAEDRRDATPDPMRIASSNLDRLADRIERDGSEALGDRALAP